MPLVIEIYDPKTKKWKELNQLIPGDPMASMSNHSVIGGREVYLFGCEPDDRLSTLFQSMAGVDVDLSADTRAVMVERGQLREVKRIEDGESFEMSVISDRMLALVRIRFRHVMIDFGTRHCLICEQEIAANQFGGHVLEHSMDEVAEWPGGPAEFLASLRRSLNESVKRAKGFPRVQQRLKLSLKAVNGFEKRVKANFN